MENNVMETRNNKKIVLCEWKAKNPIAIMVLAHGAAEHIYRYKHFAQYLADNGVSVIGYNHIGHGDNKAPNHKGVYFGAQNGDKIIVNDFEDVCLYAYKHNPDLPIFAMGHSMGSMVVRAFAMQTKLMVNGIIICGSLHPDNKTVKGGLMAAKFLYTVFGKEKYSKKLNSLAFGSFEKSISNNEENIKEYTEDQDCGIMFANKSIYDLIQLMGRIIDPENIKKMIKTKYFVISGKDDPFSNKTKDLKVFIKELDKDGFDYSLKYYENMKHEILNEKDKDMVYIDILNFIKDASK